MKGKEVLLRLSLFAAAMAYLEAAVVVYLRRIYYPENLRSLFPLKVWAPADLLLELGRELSTVVMIAAASALVSRGRGRVFAAFLYLFGLWDILYYAWLKVLIDWPGGWLEWDILFLIPWAWLGPWPAPAVIASLFVLWGGWVTLSGAECSWSLPSVLPFAAGALVALGSFLAPGYPLLAGGEEAITSFRPGNFHWTAFGAGTLLMALGLTAALPRPGREGEGL